MYIRVEHLFNPIYNCFKNSSTYNRHVCCQEERAIDTELLSHLVYESPDVVWQHGFLPMPSQCYKVCCSLSIYRIFYSCHFCHPSQDLHNYGTDLLPGDSPSSEATAVLVSSKQMYPWYSSIPHLSKTLYWGGWRSSWLHWLCTRNV